MMLTVARDWDVDDEVDGWTVDGCSGIAVGGMLGDESGGTGLGDGVVDGGLGNGADGGISGDRGEWGHRADGGRA